MWRKLARRLTSQNFLGGSATTEGESATSNGARRRGLYFIRLASKGHTDQGKTILTPAVPQATTENSQINPEGLETMARTQPPVLQGQK